MVGLGKIARDQHVPEVGEERAFVLAASVDPAATALDGVPHFASLRGLLDSGLPFDAAAICTPPQLRAGLAMEALAAGKHVLLEKPPATTPGEVAALEQRARAAGLTLFAAWHSRFAAGVAPARAWLAGKSVRRVEIVWREDVRVWHPGQRWIWREGGFGVFDPGINALSIVTALLDGPLHLRSAVLQVPANCATPIAAQLELSDDAGVAVSADLDFLQQGPQTWDIRIETDGGELLLSRGGSVLRTPEGILDAPDDEYGAIYSRFAALIRSGACDADTEPLRIVADTLARGEVRPVAEFHE
jgi:D-galactose 1-dehydrogenase